MKLPVVAALTSLIALLPGAAFAHPGAHGGSLFEALRHLLSAPDHLGLAWVALVIGGGAWVIDAVLQRHRNHDNHGGDRNGSR